MKLHNVKLIFAREVRDQLRDRRTLFMVAVLPVLLYPLLGVGMLQVVQFMQERPTRVLVVGSPKIDEQIALFHEGRFADRWFGHPSSAKLLEACFAPKWKGDARKLAIALVQKGDYDAALFFPPDFAAKLDAFRQAIAKSRDKAATKSSPPAIPNPEIICNTANDKSQLTYLRLSAVLQQWSRSIGEENLKASGVSMQTAQPFVVEAADLSTARGRNGAVWSKLLPVLLLLWALTGAFYPAVDLCAGEKERGTLETLLCSPAERGEIVVGKLLTVMLFSVVTALLNLASVAITGSFVLAMMSDLGPPPPLALVAMAVALVPMAAMFSALCLALAAMARSTKEGQYYLMPLLLVTLPLVLLPMSPGVELNLGNSLIPVTGVALVLRSVLEGDFTSALLYLPAVATVTLLACLMSIRWAVEQFNRESVLFRESEQFDLRLWLGHLWRDRRPTPSMAAAIGCAAVILMIHFFRGLSLGMPQGFGDLFRTVLTTQLGVIAAPALLLTFLLAGSPRQTLLLKRSPRFAIGAAVLLAVVLHPASTLLQTVVRQLYPISDSVRPSLEKITTLFHNSDVWPLLLAIAVVPAVCEELAFRGFILSGFRSQGRPWRAIVFTSLLFGLAHGILQQSLIASLLGLILGYLAVQSSSILPCIAFHACHNALAVANTRITADMVAGLPWLRSLLLPGDEGGCAFQWTVIVAGLLAAVLLLSWFGRLSGPKSKEEPHGELLPTPSQILDATAVAQG